MSSFPLTSGQTETNRRFLKKFTHAQIDDKVSARKYQVPEYRRLLMGSRVYEDEDGIIFDSSHPSWSVLISLVKEREKLELAGELHLTEEQLAEYDNYSYLNSPKDSLSPPISPFSSSSTPDTHNLPIVIPLSSSTEHSIQPKTNHSDHDSINPLIGSLSPTTTTYVKRSEPLEMPEIPSKPKRPISASSHSTSPSTEPRSSVESPSKPPKKSAPPLPKRPSRSLIPPQEASPAVPSASKLAAQKLQMNTGMNERGIVESVMVSSDVVGVLLTLLFRVDENAILAVDTKRPVDRNDLALEDYLNRVRLYKEYLMFRDRNKETKRRFDQKPGDESTDDVEVASKYIKDYCPLLKAYVNQYLNGNVALLIHPHSPSLSQLNHSSHLAQIKPLKPGHSKTQQNEETLVKSEIVTRNTSNTSVSHFQPLHLLYPPSTLHLLPPFIPSLLPPFLTFNSDSPDSTGIDKAKLRDVAAFGVPVVLRPIIWQLLLNANIYHTNISSADINTYLNTDMNAHLPNSISESNSDSNTASSGDSSLSLCEPFSQRYDSVCEEVVSRVMNAVDEAIKTIDEGKDEENEVESIVDHVLEFVYSNLISVPSLTNPNSNSQTEASPMDCIPQSDDIEPFNINSHVSTALSSTFFHTASLSSLRVIIVDVVRTFTQLYHFRDPIIRRILSDVLVRFCFFMNFEYKQGINYITAPLLLCRLHIFVDYHAELLAASSNGLEDGLLDELSTPLPLYEYYSTHASTYHNNSDPDDSTQHKLQREAVSTLQYNHLHHRHLRVLRSQQLHLYLDRCNIISTTQALVSLTIPNLYDNNEFYSLQCLFAIFRLLLLYHDPELASYLDQLEMVPELFISPWLLTLHVNKLKNISVLLHLWNAIIIHSQDHPYLHVFLSIALLLTHRDTILSLNDMLIPEFLSSLTFTRIDEVDLVTNRAIQLVSNTPKTALQLLQSILTDNFDRTMQESRSSKDREKNKLVDIRESGSRGIYGDYANETSLKALPTVPKDLTRELRLLQSIPCLYTSVKELVSLCFPTHNFKHTRPPKTPMSPMLSPLYDHLHSKNNLLLTNTSLGLSSCLVLDTRRRIDYDKGHLPSSMNIPSEVIVSGSELNRLLQMCTITPDTHYIVLYGGSVGGGSGGVGDYTDYENTLKLVYVLLGRGVSRVSMCQWGYKPVHDVCMQEGLTLIDHRPECPLCSDDGSVGMGYIREMSIQKDLQSKFNHIQLVDDDDYDDCMVLLDDSSDANIENNDIYVAGGGGNGTGVGLDGNGGAFSNISINTTKPNININTASLNDSISTPSPSPRNKTQTKPRLGLFDVNSQANIYTHSITSFSNLMVDSEGCGDSPHHTRTLQYKSNSHFHDNEMHNELYMSGGHAETAPTHSKGKRAKNIFTGVSNMFNNRKGKMANLTNKLFKRDDKREEKKEGKSGITQSNMTISTYSSQSSKTETDHRTDIYNMDLNMLVNESSTSKVSTPLVHSVDRGDYSGHSYTSNTNTPSSMGSPSLLTPSPLYLPTPSALEEEPNPENTYIESPSSSLFLASAYTVIRNYSVFGPSVRHSMQFCVQHLINSALKIMAPPIPHTNSNSNDDTFMAARNIVYASRHVPSSSNSICVYEGIALYNTVLVVCVGNSSQHYSIETTAAAKTSHHIMDHDYDLPPSVHFAASKYSTLHTHPSSNILGAVEHVASESDTEFGSTDYDVYGDDYGAKYIYSYRQVDVMTHSVLNAASTLSGIVDIKVGYMEVHDPDPETTSPDNHKKPVEDDDGLLKYNNNYLSSLPSINIPASLSSPTTTPVVIFIPILDHQCTFDIAPVIQHLQTQQIPLTNIIIASLVTTKATLLSISMRWNEVKVVALSVDDTTPPTDNYGIVQNGFNYAYDQHPHMSPGINQLYSRYIGDVPL